MAQSNDNSCMMGASQITNLRSSYRLLHRHHHRRCPVHLSIQAVHEGILTHTGKPYPSAVGVVAFVVVIVACLVLKNDQETEVIEETGVMGGQCVQKTVKRVC